MAKDLLCSTNPTAGTDKKKIKEQTSTNFLIAEKQKKN